MPSPKGAYTPRSGPLGGQSFASYFQYQQARSHALGFTSYSAERRERSDPMFRALEARLSSVGGASRNAAINTVRQFMQTQSKNASGGRKANAIAWGIDHNLWANGDDADDDIPY